MNLMPNLLLIARSTKADDATPTRINRRAMVADKLTIHETARGYWGLYNKSSDAQIAAGNVNAVNTHKLRIELA
jgi:hypothetical protein